MEFRRSFLKSLHVFGVLFGGKAKKLTGIQDKNNKLIDSVTFTAPDTVSLSSTAPDFLESGVYFRVTGSTGPNNGLLFRVKSVLGTTITLDTTASGVDVLTTAPAESLTLDARLAIVHNNPLISKLNSEGNTIYNVANGSITTVADDCDLGLVLAEHYHDDGAGGSPTDCYTMTFNISDWFSSDAGDLYSIDVVHNLDITFPDIRVFDDSAPDETILLHRQRVIDSNTLRISVTQEGMDCRFNGRICVSK
jgi:hypothetical protein